MSLISIENTSFTTEELKKPGQGSWSGFSDNSIAALQFCRDWLSGKKSFELHTSGSVGKPVPISLSREQILASIRMSASALGLNSSLKTLVCLPAHYIAGMMMLARVLELGMDAKVAEPAGDPLATLVEDHDYTFVSLVPLQLQKVLESEAGRRKFQRFKIVLIGGAPLNAALEKQLKDLEPAVYHTYGMTETASHIGLRRLNGENASLYFTPLPGIEIALDERGCLKVKGTVTRGDFLQTNDLAEISSEGFRLLGRIDNAVNTGGVKVQIEKVEQAIEKLGEIKIPFFVSSIPDPMLGEKLVAVFEDMRPSEDFGKELREKLKGTLSRFEIPAAIFVIPRFVYTVSGKINRKATIGLIKKA